MGLMSDGGSNAKPDPAAAALRAPLAKPGRPPPPPLAAIDEALTAAAAAGSHRPSVLYKAHLWRATGVRRPRVVQTSKDVYFPRLFAPAATFKQLPPDGLTLAAVAEAMPRPAAKRPRVAAACGGGGGGGPVAAGEGPWGCSGASHPVGGPGCTREGPGYSQHQQQHQQQQRSQRADSGAAASSHGTNAGCDGGSSGSGVLGGPHPAELFVPRRRSCRTPRRPRPARALTALLEALREGDDPRGGSDGGSGLAATSLGQLPPPPRRAPAHHHQQQPQQAGGARGLAKALLSACLPAPGARPLEEQRWAGLAQRAAALLGGGGQAAQARAAIAAAFPQG